MKDELLLKDLEIDVQKLSKLGFIKENNYYRYENKIMNDEFLLSITIDENNTIDSDVIELSTGEKFVLYYVTTATGEYVGKIRKEYNNIVEAIKNECCSKNAFKSEYAKLIIKYVKEKYNDELEYLWEKLSNNAIWRNKDNNKWYGALLTVEQRKIGINEDGKVEIIDLLLEPEKIEKMIDNEKYFAGYHMNKKHWITVKLDGSVNVNEIYNLIDISYKLSIKK